MATLSEDTPVLESNPDLPVQLSRLVQLDNDSEDAITIIRSILPHSRELDLHDSQRFIDALDKAADALKQDLDLYRKSLLALRKICGSKGILPSSHVLSQRLAKSGNAPSAYGGFAEVWEGTYEDRRIAIKILKALDHVERADVIKCFYKEAAIWKQLSHPNIVPFLGVSDVFPPLCMVSDWMPYGNMTDYIKSNPDANRPKLLVDICKGIRYLHSLNIVHGDLKGLNILINSHGDACLGDFGLTFVICHVNSVNASTILSGVGGTWRWMAPELLNSEIDGSADRDHSTASDVYALGMVAIELFSGRLPFHEFREHTVIIKIVEGKRPGRPEESLQLGLCDDIWDLINMCWEHKREERPDISFVLNRLRAIAPGISLLERLADFDSGSKSSIDILRPLLENPQGEVLAANTESEIVRFTEVLDQAIGSIHTDVELQKKAVSVLTTVYSLTGTLPSSYQISDNLKKTHARARVLGAYADIWEGTCGDHPVAIKVLRISSSDEVEVIREQVFQQAITWKQLSHPNIVRFLGISNPLLPCIVSQWMSHGQLTEYLLLNPNANRIQLMIDVGSGLEYLHSRNIVNRELKASHVLVNIAKRACLICSQPTVISSRNTSCPKGSWRWIAPEILDPQAASGSTDDRFSLASDAYAFGMVFIEAFTGELPFHEFNNDRAPIPDIMLGARRLQFGLADNAWELIQRCLHSKVNKRPTISFVLRDLQRLLEGGPISISKTLSSISDSSDDRDIVADKLESNRKEAPRSQPSVKCNIKGDTLYGPAVKGHRLIIVMGTRTPAKSSLINFMSGSNAQIRPESESSSKTIIKSHPFILDGYQTTLADLPGFTNEQEADEDILKTISTFLTEYVEGQLSGVIYMHHRYDSSRWRNIAMLEKLCGTPCFQNVTIVTEVWKEINLVRPDTRGERLESDAYLFGKALDQGARIMRYTNTLSSAGDIVRPLVGKTPTRLLVQVEMMKEKDIFETSAGLELRHGEGFPKQEGNKLKKDKETWRARLFG